MGWVDRECLKQMRMAKSTIPTEAITALWGPRATETSAANGLVGPDRTPHPALTEVWKVYQYVGFRPADLSKRTGDNH
jgi:hypothetical protein